MFDDGSAGLTYAVVTDELVRAASAVLQVTESAKAATIETPGGRQSRFHAARMRSMGLLGSRP